MSDIFDLLNINPGVFTDFPLLARQVADHQTERVVNANVRALKVIEDKMTVDNPVKASPKSIEEVINKVRYYARHGEHADFSLHDLRLVSYYMVKLQGDEKSYDYAIQLLRYNWRSLFFNGLVFYLLNSWNTLILEYRRKVCDLVTEKLSEYQDNNKKYLLFKNHANFFEENGPFRMSALVMAKGMNLFDAPTIIGYKPSTFSLSYYSDVIINFIKKRDTADLDAIETILRKHDYDRTKKLVFAYLVGEADRSGNQLMQTNVSKLASRMLGDITLASTWAPFVGASADDIAKLRKAKELVNHWFARRLINVFFEVCVQDESRKEYWLGILEKGWVKDIRIVGSALVKRKLQADNRISNMFERYFIGTKSRTSETAAIILCVKNKVMIEFSDVGALYVYNPDRDVISFINKGSKEIDSINDLKMTYLNLIVDKQSSNYYTYYYDEGKHYHTGYWQSRLDDWMSQKISNYGIESITFSDGVDEKIFKENPIETEKYTIKEPVEEKEENSPFAVFNEKPVGGTTTNIKETDSSERMKATEKDGGVEYHSYVLPKVASKWVLNGRCRVVGNEKNFYIEVNGNHRFALIRPLNKGESTRGSIWIRRPNAYGYQEVVYVSPGRDEIIIGYIKKENGFVIYRATMGADSIKRIKLV